jgi:hypothetical protein
MSMYIVRDVQRVKDRVESVEKELSHSISDLERETRRNFKVLWFLVALEAIPTLQALGVPTHEIVPTLVKSFLGFIGILT